MFLKALDQKQIRFSTNEGTWMSVDIHPNGNDIAFELVGDIYTIPKKGGQAKSIIKGRAFQSQPRFSKDGKWIVFISDESGSDNIWIAKSNGKSMRKLTAIENSTMLSHHGP